jgi:hypothetical protein
MKMPNFIKVFHWPLIEAIFGHYSLFTGRSRRQKPALIEGPWQRCGSVIRAPLRRAPEDGRGEMKINVYLWFDKERNAVRLLWGIYGMGSSKSTRSYSSC